MTYTDVGNFPKRRERAGMTYTDVGNFPKRRERVGMIYTDVEIINTLARVNRGRVYSMCELLLTRH